MELLESSLQEGISMVPMPSEVLGPFPGASPVPSWREGLAKPGTWCSPANIYTTLLLASQARVPHTPGHVQGHSRAPWDGPDEE